VRVSAVGASTFFVQSPVNAPFDQFTFTSPGTTASSDVAGTQPSSTNPLVITVHSPSTGTITFTKTGAGGVPTGYFPLPVGATITAPLGTTGAPLTLTFQFDASLLPPGTTIGGLAVFRDGSKAGACTGTGKATPDPCIVSVTQQGTTITVIVLSSHASSWALAVQMFTLTGKHGGSFTISVPTYLSGVTITGPVTVKSGGALIVSHSKVNGPVTAVGAQGVRICASTINGSLKISGTTGFVIIGDAGDDPLYGCGHNVLSGPVSLNGNLGGLELGGNTISGSVSVASTTGTGPDPEDLAPEIEGNSITGSLSCSANSPAPTDDGQHNGVSSLRSGQCSASTF
jgi:hypothetical protein